MAKSKALNWAVVGLGAALWWSMHQMASRKRKKASAVKAKLPAETSWEGEGGALPKLVQPIKYFAGSALGSGMQTMPWIHIEDLCRMFLEALVNPAVKGIFNGVSPNSVTNNELTIKVANVLNRPLILPKVPAFIIKLIFGELSQLVLYGAPVSAKKIIETGFKFNFPEISSALTNLLKGDNK